MVAALPEACWYEASAIDTVGQVSVYCESKLDISDAILLSVTARTSV